MDQETFLHGMLRGSEDQIQYDNASKLVLSQKPILARLLSYCVSEYKNCPPKEIETLLEEPLVSQVAVGLDETAPSFHSISKEDVTLSEGKVIYDIYVLAKLPDSDDEIGLIINVEAQNRSDPGYPLTRRAVYYASRMLSSQFGILTDSVDYGKLRKVYSIWICTNARNKEERNSIVEYRFSQNVLVGQFEEQEKNYDLQHIIMLNLGELEGNGAAGILKLLNAIMSNELPLTKKEEILTEYEIPMTEAVKGGIESMCNLSDGIFSKGREEGRFSTLIANLSALMESMHMTLDAAMNALKVPEEQRAAIQKALS